MLQLKNIVKNYAEGDNTVRALRGISLDFRKSDFVSILGPSGCGKTTMLNIIGGLDQYTDGDLIIDGVSTKDYKDRDWDTYRNHSVGFVFQSYHLIPHQSVLQNVELALTLSGVSRKERRRRAKEALEAVGLADQIRKRPGEMSGGQMQRVAIARALVNNPDIILADEPTGALDTETSVQVMELLKEISKDRLVIMVTHNPDLAERYSTRIIRMLDGEITSDSAPLSQCEFDQAMTEQKKPAQQKKKERKPSMSLWTAFGLSLKNLFSKKGRTTLTAFAGSIGIIGIALIWAVSQGMHTYINTVQEEVLASYPLTLEATAVDLSTLMETFMGAGSGEGVEHDKDAVYSRPVLFEMINSLNNMEAAENDLRAFKAYIEQQMEDPASKLSEAVNGIQYSYNLDLLVYTENVDGQIVYSDMEKILTEAIARNMGMDMSGMLTMRDSMTGAMGSLASMSSSSMQLWSEMLPGTDGELINPMIKEQYELIEGGNWPNEYDEIVLVLDENNELSDMALVALGLTSEDEIDLLFDAVQNGTQLDSQLKKWSYEEIMDMEFRVILNSECYRLDENTGMYTDMRQTENGLRYLYDNAIPLKVTGIIRLKEDAKAGVLRGAIAYTTALTEHVVAAMQDSAAIEQQINSPETDILTGLPFKPEEGAITPQEKENRFREHVAKLDTQAMAQTYISIMSIPSQEQIAAVTEQTLSSMSREEQEATLVSVLSQQMGMSQAEVESYTASMSQESIYQFFYQMIEQQLRAQMAEEVFLQLGSMDAQQLAMALTAAMPNFTTEQCAQYYDELLNFSTSTYEMNLQKLGYVDMENPAAINLYATSFENKDVIADVIAQYNSSVDELQQIQYTDYLGIMMSSITTIIDAITYVLIAFVAISLVVSSIMIGVITLISVQERTKEIGILRAIGASKRNVSNMFNAETVLIGFAAGALGVLLTYLLCIPINAIIQAATGIPQLGAYLPVDVALLLVGISVVLTLISGLIPARSAAKKDPVVALRTE